MGNLALGLVVPTASLVAVVGIVGDRLRARRPDLDPFPGLSWALVAILGMSAALIAALYAVLHDPYLLTGLPRYATRLRW